MYLLEAALNFNNNWNCLVRKNPWTHLPSESSKNQSSNNVISLDNKGKHKSLKSELIWLNTDDWILIYGGNKMYSVIVLHNWHEPTSALDQSEGSITAWVQSAVGFTLVFLCVCVCPSRSDNPVLSITMETTRLYHWQLVTGSGWNIMKLPNTHT